MGFSFCQQHTHLIWEHSKVLNRCDGYIFFLFPHSPKVQTESQRKLHILAKTDHYTDYIKLYSEKYSQKS